MRLSTFPVTKKMDLGSMDDHQMVLRITKYVELESLKRAFKII